MIHDDERRLADWLQEGPRQGPPDGLTRALAQARRTGQRPAWAAGDRWPPVLAIGPAGLRPVVVFVVLVALLLLAGLLVVLSVGSRRNLPPALGTAGNGEVAYSDGGRLWLLEPGATQARQVTVPHGKAYTPFFSRDGTTVAFFVEDVEGGPLALYAADADGSNVRLLSGSMQIWSSRMLAPSWSPDGRSIVFQSAVDGVDRLYTVATDGSGVPVQVFGDTRAARETPAWSPDGAWIAFTWSTKGVNASEGVSIVHPDGTGLRVLFTRERGQDTPITGPVWAPDGSALTFAYAPSGSQQLTDGPYWWVAVAPVDGEAVPVYKASILAPMSWPTWSPDGSLIAVGLGDAGQNGGVVVMEADGRNPRWAMRGSGQGGEDCWPLWSPDGLTIVVKCGPFALLPRDAAGQPSALPIPATADQFEWQRRGRCDPCAVASAAP